MKKLPLFLFYALLSPTLTLGSSALLAAQDSDENTDLGEQSMGQDVDPAIHSPEHDKEVIKSKYNTAEPAGQTTSAQAGMQNKGYMASSPANAMAASDLIGTELKTSGDESVGEISDLVIGEDGKIAAVVVNVGEYLGMGGKHVTIDWNAVKRSGNPDERELRVDMTGEDLHSAPSYEKSED